MFNKKTIKKKMPRKAAVRKSSLPRKPLLSRYSLRLVLLSVVILSGFGVRELFLSVDVFPIKQIKVEGEFVYLNKDSIKERIKNLSIGSFFVLDIEALREELLKMQWVNDAFVRREWPYTVVIRVVEKEPVAKWNKTKEKFAVLTATGDLFYPQQYENMASLVELNGPDNRHAYVLSEFNKMQSMLYQANLHIQKATQNERRSWKIQVEGIEINLGRKDIFKKIERLAVVYQSLLKPKINKIKEIDFRYTNGFAVQWLEVNQINSNTKDYKMKKEILTNSNQGLLMGALGHV